MLSPSQLLGNWHICGMPVRQMSRLLLQTVTPDHSFQLVSRGLWCRADTILCPPIEVSDVSFPTVGPAALAVSLPATSTGTFSPWFSLEGRIARPNSL